MDDTIKVSDDDIPIGLSLVLRSKTCVHVASVDMDGVPTRKDLDEFIMRDVAPMAAQILDRIQTHDS